MPTYPYISGPGPLLKAFEQLRKGFPPKVDAGYLQRFKIAPSNESYLIGILRYLGLIDEEGNRKDDRVDFFYGPDDKFQAGLDAVLRDAYKQLFEENPDAYTKSREDLGHWFRGADKTSELVGGRQAGTFLVLAGLAGKAAQPQARTATAAPKPRVTKPPKVAAANGGADPAARGRQKTDPTPPPGTPGTTGKTDVGLTVRIEVNLPAGGDAATYDAIFASIKRHLIP